MTRRGPTRLQRALAIRDATVPWVKQHGKRIDLRPGEPLLLAILRAGFSLIYASIGTLPAATLTYGLDVRLTG